MNKMKITKRHARKVLAVVKHGLSNGLGDPEPGKMCVEAAVCFALGLPHGDDPNCVSQAVRAFKMGLNDANWPSNKARSKGMAKIAIAQLGSDGIDDVLFAKELARLTIMRIVPIALRSAAKLHTDAIHKKALLSAAKLCESEGTATAARAASYAASYAAKAASVKVLCIAADIGVEVLKIAGSPGCKWLDIVE